jgi:predicted ribosome quality control (RQC) complex YloA/Tae2 family protein
MKPSDKQGQAYPGLEKGNTYENLGNSLDRVNPYEFRKGMDYELTKMGCSRLAESTLEEREKSTESVLKNLEEHAAYYSALIQFEAGMNQGGKISESSFKKYLENYTSERGDGMVEVKNEIKDDKMTEPKYKKEDTTIPFKTSQLKEAISNEIKNILLEKKEDDDKDEKKASKGAKGMAKKMKVLDKEVEKLEKEKDKNKEKLKPSLDKFKDGKMSADEYREKTKSLVDRNKEIVKRVKEIEKEKEAISLNEKLGRREVAKTMMEKDTHMAILEIIKEYGVSLREGSQGVKAYYEIAKTAYQEGFMAGLHKIN